jgi:RecB family exonuclease
VITPRRTRLHRAPTLSALRARLCALTPIDDVDAARATIVLLPTRSAADLLRRTLEDRAPSSLGAIVLPDLLTRRDWYERLHARQSGLPRLLTGFEREVLVEAAAHEAITEGATPPFNLRPALVGEVLAFYDDLRRHRQSVDDFERLLVPTFEAAAEFDPGAERLLRQTRFLAATFHGYEHRLETLGLLDEHLLRTSLLELPATRPYRTMIVAVGDIAHDPNGLAAADFDLITRMPGLEAVEIVATEGQLATGLLERLHGLLPDLEEERVPPPDAPLERPALVVPVGNESLYFMSRDREDEIADLVRRIRELRRLHPTVRLDHVAVVVGRPLPYVYLARDVFAAGGVPVQLRDALPLAAEPFAAALDLVFTAVATRFGASSLAALLRSPHFRFTVAETVIHGRDVAALEVGLAAFDYAGDPERLEDLAGLWQSGALAPPRDPRWDGDGAVRAAAGAASIVRALAPLVHPAPASAALDILRRFLETFAAAVPWDDPLRERLLRARGGVLAILDALSAAHRSHHDLHWTIDELSATVRRRVEGETFTPAHGRVGVLLVDAAAAPFGDFDTLHLVGLVDGEWPARRRRNVFYSHKLLSGLGWPADPDATSAVREGFIDLLQSPRRHVSLSTFSLEDDALVDRSPLIEDAGRAGLIPTALAVPSTLVFDHEALMARPVPTDVLSDAARRWVELRTSRPDASSPQFHGRTAARPTRAWSVSAVELYGQCPFKFFARHVLRLGEERVDEEGLTPLERGRFLHETFEAFYHAWQERRNSAVTADRLEEARVLFEEVLAPRLEHLSPSDAAIERTRFLGSPVAAGLIDVVLRMEAEREVPVVERWLEHRLEGAYSLRSAQGAREVALRGVADRIDLLKDGTFRVIDYKSSRASSDLQLAIYATAARQRLAGYRGRDWVLGEAAYVAFREDPPVKRLGRGSEPLDPAIEQEEMRFVAYLDAIERGEFPPRPVQRSLCVTCAWAGICRKDYVEAEGDDTEPAV